MKRMIPMLIAFGMIITLILQVGALAAAQSPEDRYETGMAYFNGDGVEQDYEHAFSYFMIAGEVEQYPSALNMLGICFRDGKGTKQNTDEALACFQRAASLGSSDAEKNLQELQAARSRGSSKMSVQPVTGFCVLSIGTTSAVLSWEKNKDVAAYELSYKLHSASKWNILKSSVSETKSGINNLQPGKSYDFRIKAITENAESEYTELNNIYTKYMKVSWLKPQEESGNSVKLTWADNSSTNIFEISYCLTGQQARTVKVFGTTYTLYNLEPGVYEFKIRAIGTGPASDYTGITYKLAKKNQIGDEEENSKKEVSIDKNAEGYIGTVQGTWGEKVALNNSYTHSYELDQPIENCKSLTMTFSIHNVTGDPRGKYYLYGRRIHGRWEHLGEFELSSNKEGTTVTQTFTFKKSEGVQITAFAVNQHVAEGVGTWSFNSNLSISDVYVYE